MVGADHERGRAAVIGETIDGKYLVRRILGQGGMGSVYEAEHTGTGRRCAVKVINSLDLSQDPQVLSRFEREARAAGAIDTQYITQVLDAGLDRNSTLPFLAMEYLEGEDLQHLSKRIGAVSPDLMLRVVAQTCLGLEKAHQQGVVHRDIKPHNLFLAQRDAGEIVIKLLDFGIAKVKMEQANTTDGADLTKTGSLLGSPLYVSPEQARGKRQIDHRTDLYSLGAVGYQMLCGRTPFHHATALGDLILMVVTEPPPPISEFAPWVPPEIEAIVQKCLVKNPDERFQSAQELFDAILPFLPNGWGIHKNMLVSVNDSASVEVPRLSQLPMSGPTTGASGTVSMSSPSVGAATADTPISGRTVVGGAISGSTTGPIIAEPEPMRSGGTKTKLIVVGAALAVSAAALGVLVMKGEKPPAAAADAAATQPATAAVTATPAADATAATTSAAAAVESKPKRVQVSIEPRDAKVAVEGVDVAVKDGILELTGALGSVHRVRVSKGTGETTADIVITENGALPVRVEVVVGKKTLITRKADGTTSASAVPAVGPVPRGIQKNVGEFN